MPLSKRPHAVGLSEPERDELAELLERQGSLELSSACVLGHGLVYASTLDEKILLSDELRDEIHHFESLAGMYEEIGAGNLQSAVDPAAFDLPQIRNRAGLEIGRYIVCRAAIAQLEIALEHPFTPYRVLCARLRGEELSHARASASAMEEVAESGQFSKVELQRVWGGWLGVARRLLTRSLGLGHSSGRSGNDGALARVGVIDGGRAARAERVARAFAKSVEPFTDRFA